MNRDLLRRRLEEELCDVVLAGEVVASLDDAAVERLATLASGHITNSAALSYRPQTIADDLVDTLWVLAFGYRLANAEMSGVELGGEVPPMSDLKPGPVNELLAKEAAAFVARCPVPVLAQWEVAGVLTRMGVPGVISVEPDQDADGSVVYLSTRGVLTKGLRLADAAGIQVGQAGLLSHSDHASRSLMTAEAVGLTAAVSEGVALPTGYDSESGQVWTRSRRDFIPGDLMARTDLGRLPAGPDR